MRKLILQEWISLDGYAEDKNGNLDFFPDTEVNKYSEEDQLQFIKRVSVALMGRKTYKIFIEYWPTVSTDKEIMADALNAMPKMVFSNTLDRAPWGEGGKWPDAEVVKGDAIAEIRKMKDGEGGDMVVWGSISLAQELIRAGLIDEYHLQVCPTAIGGGKLLFPQMEDYLKLKLIEAKRYEETGTMLLKYVKA